MSSSRITRSASAAAASGAAAAEDDRLSDIEDDIYKAGASQSSEDDDSLADVEVELDDDQSLRAGVRGRPPGVHSGPSTDWQGKGTFIGSCPKTTEAKKAFRDGLGFRLKRRFSLASPQSVPAPIPRPSDDELICHPIVRLS